VARLQEALDGREEVGYSELCAEGPLRAKLAVV
jgi:hypothetical protein